MATLSSGHTQHLQNIALRNDKRNALLKVQSTWKQAPCPINIKPTAQLVSTCTGFVGYQAGQQNSSSQLGSQMSGMIYYKGTTSGVPESVRLQQLTANTADASQGIPFRNPDGSFSYLPDPLTRFSQYTPYKPPPCPAPLPYTAINPGEPLARIPPCTGPRNYFV